MCCVPRLDKKWAEEEAKVELKAKHSDFTSGCVYYARCPLASKDEGCTRDRPTLLEAERDHFVACSKL